ncbi:hypothetical protein DLM78_18290 [Leptospira stimsonii]|uniref:Uncharacterized protein n=1 Tax=Leptospira stimsonii TaxID=2202203 RepID=A0A8B3CP98_9LEPT|nr:hypothetical protein DLM78_18290 [Leptospira stimsonii]
MGTLTESYYDVEVRAPTKHHRDDSARKESDRCNREKFQLLFVKVAHHDQFSDGAFAQSFGYFSLSYDKSSRNERNLLLRAPTKRFTF